MIDEYPQLLADKEIKASASGFDVPLADLNPAAFDWQQQLTWLSLRRGKSAIFADCGLGKSLMLLDYGQQVYRHTNKPVLIVAPLAVARQTAQDEAPKFGYDIALCKEQADVKPGLNITNYERIHLFSPRDFAAIILDECFAPDTLIDMIGLDGLSTKKYIKDIRIGDKIVNASGVDTVSDVHRREVPYAVQVTIAGYRITCSPNHPFFTQRGWVSAQDLQPGDCALETSAAMCLVWGDVHPETSGSVGSAILRDILLSEMANASAGASRESPQSRSGGEARTSAPRISSIRNAGSNGANRAHSFAQSNEQSINTRESLPPIERDRPRTFRAWGQWDAAHVAANSDAENTWQRMDSGICFVTGETESRLSDVLQARSSQSRAENKYRGGWALASEPQGDGYKTRYDAGFARVDSLTVLELGHHELDQYRDADGKLYFYDIGGTRHPSFSINGYLVHNSSILKGGIDSKTYQRLATNYKDTPYKLCCTATPAPNDMLELLAHIEHLGVMDGNAVKACFFQHDGGNTKQWVLRPHAEEAFWRFVASWAVMLRNPDDIGYDGARYHLPELYRHNSVVAIEHQEGAAEGSQLIMPGFAKPARTMTERRNARRLSLADRVMLTSEIIASEPDKQWVVWCSLNPEGEALVKAIPGAVEVAGRHDDDTKADRMLAFAHGDIQVLVTKAKIAGRGMNWQNCSHTVSCGLSDSYEDLYQYERRFWRFGQQHNVHHHIVTSELDTNIIKNIARKEAQHEHMMAMMIDRMHDAMIEEIHGTQNRYDPYNPQLPMLLPDWLSTEVLT